MRKNILSIFLILSACLILTFSLAACEDNVSLHPPSGDDNGGVYTDPKSLDEFIAFMDKTFKEENMTMRVIEDGKLKKYNKITTNAIYTAYNDSETVGIHNDDKYHIYQKAATETYMDNALMYVLLRIRVYTEIMQYNYNRGTINHIITYSAEKDIFTIEFRNVNEDDFPDARHTHTVTVRDGVMTIKASDWSENSYVTISDIGKTAISPPEWSVQNPTY